MIGEHADRRESLPRLLYVADVPVQATQHGSALVFRALEAYAAERLCIVETGIASDPAKRLPGVTYVAAPIGRRRLLNTRLHGYYSAWLSLRAAPQARRVERLIAGFQPGAIVTVGHGFGWLTAAALARRLDAPLHLIIHDDWPRASAIAAPFRRSLDRAFGRVYRAAATRLCVSPFMAEAYERRYGVGGSVMYPSRSSSCPVLAPKPARTVANGQPMVIGYGGNSGPDTMPGLRDLAIATKEVGARLLIYGPFPEDARRQLLTLSDAIEFGGFVPFDRMIRELHERADVLFVPMTFELAERDNTTVSFPSKLADYTAAGVPLIIHGPQYASAVRWATANQNVSVVVDEAGPPSLRRAILELQSDRPRRQALAERAAEVGRRMFSAEAARVALYDALSKRSRVEEARA